MYFLWLLRDRLPQSNISSQHLSEFLPQNDQTQNASTAATAPIDQPIDQLESGTVSWYVMRISFCFKDYS